MFDDHLSIHDDEGSMLRHCIKKMISDRPTLVIFWPRRVTQQFLSGLITPQGIWILNGVAHVSLREIWD